MFRRRRASAADDLPEDDVELDATDDDAAGDPPPAAAVEAAPAPRPRGPWDVADAPDDELNRIDLGGLRVPVPDGTEVRVEVSPEGAVVAATLVQGENALQVNAFAAPRSYGIWSEVREEIATSLREGGGQAQEADGSFGVELAAGVPTETGQLTPARFLGIDGPRWFVRGLITGPAAVDREAGAHLEAALRDLVVVRGGEAMAVRDPLPLALPREVVEQAAAGDDVPEDLTLPERGPEITERR